MRRLLMLVPVVLFLTQSSIAYAGDSSLTIQCRGRDTSSTGFTVEAKWIDSGTVNGVNHEPILLLRRLTVTNTCASHWTRIDFVTTDRTIIGVAPGTARTFGHQGLEHLGLWHLPFNRWMLKTSYLMTGAPCSDFQVPADGPVVMHRNC